MTILVLDSNALRRGSFRGKSLDHWIEAAGEEAEVVVPEVVVWEWAEHAASAHSALQRALQEFSVDERLYERPQLPKELPTETLVKDITRLLASHATIWHPPTAAWKQGLREQVLQIGSGEVKSGIKTGAADHLVLACVGEQIDQRSNAEAVLLATNDHELTERCIKLYGDQVLIVKSTGMLLASLNTFRPAEEELYEESADALRDLVKNADSDIGSALARFDMGFRIHRGEQDSNHPKANGRHLFFARLTRVDDVELHDLSVPESKDSRVGLANLRIFGDIKFNEWQQVQSDAGGPEMVSTFSGIISDGFVDVTVAVTWNTHWKVQSVSAESPAVIVFDTSEYDDLEDVPPFHGGSTAGG